MVELSQRQFDKYMWRFIDDKSNRSKISHGGQDLLF